MSLKRTHLSARTLLLAVLAGLIMWGVLVLALVALWPLLGKTLGLSLCTAISAGAVVAVVARIGRG